MAEKVAEKAKKTTSQQNQVKSVEKKTTTKKAEPKKTEAKSSKRASESKVSVPSFDLTGAKKGTVSLPAELFSGKVNEKLMAQAIRVYLANQRQGTANTKTRSEVKGSRKKVWRQKGTGRARHGSITGPIFVGGGIVHGPKSRDYDLKMPKKMKMQALVSALTEKNKENQIFVIDGKFTGKTKEFANAVKKIVGSDKKKVPSVLFVRNRQDREAHLASRNVMKLNTVTGSDINTYEVVKNSAIVFSKDAIDEMKETFLKG